MEGESRTKEERNTQKILNKLISEEIVAVQFYRGAMNSVKPEELGAIQEKFTEIANDEEGDHLASLQKYAFENDFDIPFKNKDVEKYASAKMYRKVDTMKSKQDAAYYIEGGIESEMEAIKSFQDALSQEYLPDLQGILLKCYYDEIQHLSDLELLLRCVQIGVDLR